jgi:predicted acylesterase/phospholipase RssA
MSIEVQVAFQGGGAKLANLLAAAEVLEKAHEDGHIRITRVAGTSAGAVVACLLASGTGIANARKALLDKSMQQVAAELRVGNKFLAVAKAAVGIPILSLQPLIDWLGRQLQASAAHPIRQSVANVSEMRPEAKRIKLLIVSSDLESRQPRVATDDEEAVLAVRDSCGIPFVFSTWSGSGYRKVDGGMCSNLPVDFLLDRVQEFGEVLAVSFAPPPTKPHNGPFKYLMVLIDTAISAGEDKARQSLLAPNVFSIVTDLTTMDFKRAVTDGLGEQYLRIKSEADKWLQKYIRIVSGRALALRQDPWLDKSPSTSFVMSLVGKYFEEMESRRSIDYHLAQMVVVAKSLRADKDASVGTIDVMELELKFSACDTPLHMMQLAVTELHPESSLDISSFNCTVTNAKGESVAAVAIPMRLPGSADRAMCVCFTTPLAPRSGPYTLVYVIRGSDFMRKLLVEGVDDIAYFPTRAVTPVEEVRLILMTPVDYAVQVGQAGDAREVRKLSPNEMRQANLNGMVANGFAAKRVVKSDDLWRMTVRKQ